MATQITIGDAIPAEVWVDDDEEYVPDTPFLAEELKIPEAPKYENDVGNWHSNTRHIGMGHFSPFIRKFRLESIFSTETFPGYKEITPKMVEQLAVKLEKRKARNARRKHENVFGFGYDQDDNGARLEWLWWWCDWALNNCKDPIIYLR